MLRRYADVLLAVALALLMLGPAAVLPGYVLVGDMVFVPEQPWKDAWLGLDGSTPRAVPMDALVSLATQVVPGWVVQRLLLLGALVAAGVGASRLVADRPLSARAAALVLCVWNPWVHERLAMGQWAAVAGYALLPWVALAALGVRRRRLGWPWLVLALAAASATSPTGGVLATLVAACVLLPRRSDLVLLAGTALVVNAPWLVPAVLAPGGVPAADGSFAGFAPRAESELGTLASLITLGGIWKSSVVPPERTTVLVVGVSLALSACAVLGVLRLLRSDPARWRGLALAGVAALVLAALPAVPGMPAALDRATSVLPALAMVRDTHRFLAPACLALAVGLAAAVEHVLAGVRPGREALRAAAVVVAVLPVLLLPSSLLGHHGDLAPRSYPDDWADIRDHLVAAQPATTVVLPWTGSYRGYAWNDHRAVLDPAPRYLPGDVLVDDRIFLDDRTLPSEEPRLTAVADALAEPDAAAALRGLGVRFVLVEHGNGVVDVPAGRTVYDGRWLRLVDLGPVEAREPAGPPRAPVLVADLAAALMVVACAVVVFLARRRALYPSRG